MTKWKRRRRIEKIAYKSRKNSVIIYSDKMCMERKLSARIHILTAWKERAHYSHNQSIALVRWLYAYERHVYVWAVTQDNNACIVHLVTEEKQSIVRRALRPRYWMHVCAHVRNVSLVRAVRHTQCMCAIIHLVGAMLFVTNDKHCWLVLLLPPPPSMLLLFLSALSLLRLPLCYFDRCLSLVCAAVLSYCCRIYCCHCIVTHITVAPDKNFSNTIISVLVEQAQSVYTRARVVPFDRKLKVCFNFPLRFFPRRWSYSIVINVMKNHQENFIVYLCVYLSVLSL